MSGNNQLIQSNTLYGDALQGYTSSLNIQSDMGTRNIFGLLDGMTEQLAHYFEGQQRLLEYKMDEQVKNVYIFGQKIDEAFKASAIDAEVIIDNIPYDKFKSNISTIIHETIDDVIEDVTEESKKKSKPKLNSSSLLKGINKLNTEVKKITKQLDTIITTTNKISKHTGNELDKAFNSQRMRSHTKVNSSNVTSSNIDKDGTHDRRNRRYPMISSDLGLLATDFMYRLVKNMPKSLLGAFKKVGFYTAVAVAIKKMFVDPKTKSEDAIAGAGNAQFLSHLQQLYLSNRKHEDKINDPNTSDTEVYSRASFHALNEYKLAVAKIVQDNIATEKMNKLKEDSTPLNALTKFTHADTYPTRNNVGSLMLTSDILKSNPSGIMKILADKYTYGTDMRGVKGSNYRAELYRIEPLLEEAYNAYQERIGSFGSNVPKGLPKLKHTYPSAGYDLDVDDIGIIRKMLKTANSSLDVIYKNRSFDENRDEFNRLTKVKATSKRILDLHSKGYDMDVISKAVGDTLPTYMDKFMEALEKQKNEKDSVIQSNSELKKSIDKLTTTINDAPVKNSNIPSTTKINIKSIYDENGGN